MGLKTEGNIISWGNKGIKSDHHLQCYFFTFPRKPSKNIGKTAISSISVQGERWV